jgi:biotin carboxyl carrier protein
MKLNIQKNKNENEFQVEISSTVDLTHISKGELFPIFISNHKDKSKKVNACFIADGRSLLVENRVIRFNNTQISKKNDVYRFGIQSNGTITQNHITVSTLRSVQPRVSLANTSGGDVKSPMTGKIISVLVKNNAKVKEGDTLLIIEAMKMENRIIAEFSGIVSNIKATSSMSVSTGDFLLNIIPEPQG